MKKLLCATCLTSLVAVVPFATAHAATVISDARTTPISTGTANDDIRITSAGSIKVNGGAAVTIDSNDSVNNEGKIQITGANGATGILANSGMAGNITNSGTITIDEDYTPTDSDDDGDKDGPFAQGNNRFGIRVGPGGTFTGNVVNTGAIIVEGNQSAGIAVDSALTGSLNTTGTVTILGDDSVGIRAGAVSGNISIGNGSSTFAQGKNAVGVLLGGDIGGSLVIQGAVTSTGYRSTTSGVDTSKFDADDLLQGGSAVVVNGNVLGGILLDTRPVDADSNDTDEDDDGIADSNESTGTVTSYGAAPAMQIGSSTQDIRLGAVASSSAGHGLVIKGTIVGYGLYGGVSATGLSIGGTGHDTSVAGGMTVAGAVSATALAADATALRIGSGARVPTLAVSGTIDATGSGVENTAARGILIDQGATLNSISNSGTISATRDGSGGSATAILDRSGSLGSIQNSGTITVNEGERAIDLASNSSGATIRQVAGASGSAAPRIHGNIRFGSGDDTLDIQAGQVLGSVDFGAGAGSLNLSGSSLFRGNLTNQSGIAVSVGAGSTLDVQNTGAVNLSSLAVTGGSLGVTIASSGNTRYNVAGAAIFGAGSKMLVTLDKVGNAAGTYTVLKAGTLTGAENLTSSVVSLPFLFNSALSSDASAGTINLSITRKTASELELNRSEAAVYDAALAAADSDSGVAGVFLSAGGAADVRSTLQQLMPDHAGGAFENVTRPSRLAAQTLGTPRSVNGFWIQEVAWGSRKSVSSTSSYKLSSWGTNAGYDLGLGDAGSVGVSLGYYAGKDRNFGNELFGTQYEGGVHWRGAFGRLRAWARATGGIVKFDSTRNFSAVATGSGTITRSADADWKGTVYSGSAGLSYEARTGNFSVRPNASLDYYKLSEKGYTETGGGNALNLTVRSRKSNETAANALLTLGYDLGGTDPDSSMLRVELEGGRRQILSGSVGDTVASFGNGTPFTLEAEKRTSGWRGGLRVLAGSSAMTFAAEANAEQLHGHTAIGGRLGLNLGF